MHTDTIRISDEVREAVAEGKPVVALESTIFTHGLPRPRNVEVAMEAEELIRERGGVPATIGVVKGQPVVGLTEDEIKELAYDDDVTKASVRDLPYAAVTKKNAGTTIAATSLLARAAGIDVFATGGLGGVHHGASETFDESADIYSLADTDIIMVSSGAKAILDIAATLERFESLSIPVVGYRTMRYPGFYCVDSGFDLTAKVDSAEEAALLMETSRALGIDSAVLIANPVPEEDELDPAELDKVLEQAWAAAEEQGIHGQDSTPFLLGYIKDATDGRSLDANVALYYNNASVALDVAKAMKAK